MVRKLRIDKTAEILLCMMIVQACSIHYVPAPPLPGYAAPPLDSAGRHPATGETLVTVDVVGEQARVDRIVGRQQLQQAVFSGRGRYGTPSLVPVLQTVPVCQTPCVVSLPPGDHELKFAALDPASTSTSSAFVRVGDRPLLVRHAMGRTEDHTGRMVASILLGSLGFSTLLAGGLVVGIDSQLPPERQGIATAGWAVGGVGLAAAVASVWLGLTSATVVQPGATATFPVDGP